MNRAWIDRLFLIIALLAGIALRIWLSTRGANYDMRAWRNFADIAAQHRNIYVATDRFNYPPTWYLVLGGLDAIHRGLNLERFGQQSFHTVVASLLTLVDVGIALLLLRSFGRIVALFFFLNPVSILLTGYHSQFDNLALLPALASWLVLRRAIDDPTWRRLLASALLLGLSLAIKHILFFFPIWILLNARVVQDIRKRIVFVLISYAIFAGSFAPFLFEPGAVRSVLLNVADYARYSPNALLPTLIDAIVPRGAFDSLFGLLPSNVSAVKYLFHISMLAAGWFFARSRRFAPSELFVAYLATVLIFATVLNDNYLAIPLIACAIHWRRIASWIYCILAACVVEMSAYASNVLPDPPWWKNILPGLAPRHAVVWLIVLLIAICRRRKEESPQADRHA